MSGAEPIDLSTPLRLPCGVSLPNRIAKAAMTEGLADPHGRATDRHVRLYRRWAEGGAGMLLTGNIQIDRRSLERPGNIRIEGPQDAQQMAALARLAEAGRSGGGHIWAQIAHAGRQAVESCCPAPVAPSAVPFAMLRWEQAAPRALSEAEIVDLIERFGHAAKVCKDAGFSGVEIHGAHGYLISGFLSPATNHRTDRWGGSLANRARLLIEVLRSMRQAVGPDFPVALKLNSADFQEKGFSHADSMAVVEMLNQESLDLLELTGGTYEQLSMIGVQEDSQFKREPARASTVAREAYFAIYAAEARRVARMPVMSTGGFRRRESMVGALNDGTCDLIGLGRPLCVDPDIPRKLIAGQAQQTATYEKELHLSAAEKEGLTQREQHISTVLGTQAWFFMNLFDMGDGDKPNLSRHLPEAQATLAIREMAIAKALID